MNCGCTNEQCNHPNGEPCGKVVEHPYPAVILDRRGEVVGEEVRVGLCDACLATAGYRPA
jgi:hypothetical protein